MNPQILVTEPSADYELIDSGDGEKLERYGGVFLRRPDPQALWHKSEPARWKQAHGTFVREGREGGWNFTRPVPEKWTITFGGLSFHIRPTAFKHTGIFPEQAPNWTWMRDAIRGAGRKVTVLNLFGYTGGATLACAQAGAAVCHVDASKAAVGWARENAAVSGLADKPIRWIVDDAKAFVAREIRRGHRYDAIVMDPPAFGRGPEGDVWQIETDFVPLLEACRNLLSDTPLFFLLNGYASGYSQLAYRFNLAELARDRGGEVESGELTIRESRGGRFLPCGIFARWTKTAGTTYKTPWHFGTAEQQTAPVYEDVAEAGEEPSVAPIAIPRVSICVPAYNAEQFLPAALESVRNQTFKDWELIVTEDGSRDGAEQIVTDFAASVPQPVRYLRNETNLGLPATRNAGITASRAEVVAFLDADDVWEPNHLEATVGRLLSTGADLAHGGSLLFDSDTGRELERRAPNQEILAAFPLSLFEGSYVIQPSSVVMRKSLWERAGGFDPSFRYVEDREMWLRCARVGGRFVYTGSVTCRYRKHGDALSTHAAQMAVACARVFDKHLKWNAIPKEVREDYAAGAWIAAGRILQREHPMEASEYLYRAWSIQPRFTVQLWIIGLRIYSWVFEK